MGFIETRHEIENDNRYQCKAMVFPSAINYRIFVYEVGKGMLTPISPTGATHICLGFPGTGSYPGIHSMMKMKLKLIINITACMFFVKNKMKITPLS